MESTLPQDKYGKELDSLYEARLHALRMFKLIQFIPGGLDPTCQIRITSAAGDPVLIVFFLSRVRGAVSESGQRLVC